MFLARDKAFETIGYKTIRITNEQAIGQNICPIAHSWNKEYGLIIHLLNNYQLSVAYNVKSKWSADIFLNIILSIR